MHVQGPSVHVNTPGIRTYPGALDINGMPVQTGNYQTTTTTTYHTTQQAVPQTTNYEINEQRINTNGEYNYGYDGNYGNYDTVEYVEDTSTGCCNRRNRLLGNEFGHKRFGTAGAGSMCRRCCVGLLMLLGLLALLGLIIGLAVGLTKGRSSAKSSASANSNQIAGGYQGGYYRNGQFFVEITARPRRFYLIYGTEMPCNPYNNNTITTTPSVYPNCDKVSTKITQIFWWSTVTPRSVYYYQYSSGYKMMSSAVTLMLTSCLAFVLKRF